VKGFVQDINGLAVKNSEFRRELYTAKNLQLVVMALKPKEEIGAEVHKLDQSLRVEVGTGEVVLDGVRTPIRAGFAVVVPAGGQSRHHQYRQYSTEALGLCAAESSGRRRPPYPCRREGRQRTFRRQNDGTESQLLESPLADLGCAVVGPSASVKQALAMTDAEAQPVQKTPTIQVSSRFIRQNRAHWCRG
jgi:mannose-6-phosphate isomerase-like protein (cupin superfamily)